MASLLVDGIGELVTNDPAAGDETPLGLLREAAIVVVDDRVAWVGPASRAPDAPCYRASSIPIRTWSSPATGRRSSPRA
jgi:hypothetical protein